MPNSYSTLPTIDYYNFGRLDFNWGNSIDESSVGISIIDIDDVTRLKINLLKL